jgi:hypothetical protein
MALKNLMVRLRSRAADTLDIHEKLTGYQRKSSIQAGCTPDSLDTSCFNDTRAILQIGPFGEAVNHRPNHRPTRTPGANWRRRTTTTTSIARPAFQPATALSMACAAA